MATRSELGEGAVWDVADAALWWVDIKAGFIHRFDPTKGSNETFDFGEPVGCLARRDGGGLIVAAKSGFYLFDPATGAREFLADPEKDQPGNRFNDGGTDSRGRFWAGTMKDDGGPPERCGQFYRVDPDRSLTPYFEKVFTTNGMTFSPDGRTLYYSDSNRDVRTIWACDYDLDTGVPSNQRVFFDTRQVAGRPDGGTVDADGCYWMAGVGGWQLVRITPRGDVDMIIPMPVERPTKPMFGGANLDTLFVTSIGIGAHDDPAQPEAGSLFAVTGHGVSGIPQHRFAG
ncbi:MAG: SMP-30/gluconolactonase/LRE family protein [Pseudomonadota bacterium]